MRFSAENQPTKLAKCGRITELVRDVAGESSEPPATGQYDLGDEESGQWSVVGDQLSNDHTLAPLQLATDHWPLTTFSHGGS